MERVVKIFINPGHAPDGNPDPGAVNAVTGLRECDVALIIGRKVVTYLQNAGCEVSILQSDSLSSVVETANNWPADLFVSIHCNSAAASSANGTETWYCHNSGNGQKLAYCIQDQMVKSVLLTDRGLKEATPGVNGLYVLSNTDMPAVLVETAFISNDGDEKLLADDYWRDEFAKAIARGITDYFSQQ
jgi:N-acetylmuramoyl-L-alanine amidase